MGKVLMVSSKVSDTEGQGPAGSLLLKSGSAPGRVPTPPGDRSWRPPYYFQKRLRRRSQAEVPLNAPPPSTALSVAVWFWQITRSAPTFTFGSGFTVMVKVRGVPEQVTLPLVNTGVTVMVATNGVVPGFCATKAAMSPAPLAARPMAGALFVQLSRARHRAR